MLLWTSLTSQHHIVAEYLNACNRSVLEQINVRTQHLIVIDGYESSALDKFRQMKRNPTHNNNRNTSNKGKSAWLIKLLMPANHDILDFRC